jgi:PAT family beta-lactamase induction signal transducer AmpG
MSQAVLATRSRFAGFADRRFWFMAAFGFISGLPLLLSGSTLRQWLAEGEISRAAIGLTANIGLAYTLKFFWAPLLDHAAAPLFGRWGRRRGWLLLIQPLMTAACVWLALSNPVFTPVSTIAAAVTIAFLSSTQDIAIDAWRIETFPQALQGSANAVYVWGYRIAMLVAGTGVIDGANIVGWHGALLGIAVLMALGIVVTVAAPEPTVEIREPDRSRLIARISTSVFDPLREFMTRPGAALILGYVASFKLGEAMAGVMLNSLYRDLGFDRVAVAAAGPYSLFGTMAGIGLGGWLVARVGLQRALISTGFIQMAAMSMYVWLSVSPGDHVLLYGTVVTEAFLQGLADAAFIAYLSALCSVAHTATHFALLTSLAALSAHTVGGLSGRISQAMTWPEFYTMTMFLSVPAIVLMLILMRRYPPPSSALAATT